MQRFPLIDVLRGLSALLVVFYHVLAYREWVNFPSTGFGKLPMMGWVGVDLFFVISGFVIGKTAMEGHQRGKPWRHHYFERRLRRIAPLYIGTLALYLFLVNPDLLHQGWASVYQIGSHLGFVHNLWHQTHGSINSPNWSVGLEMQFYLLMAVCAPWLVRTAGWKVFAVWTTIAIVWRYGTTLALPPGTSNPMFQFIYASQLPGVLDEFVCGICVAKLLQADALQFTWPRFTAWTLATSGLLSLAWITVPSEVIYWKEATTIVLWRTLVCAGFAALLACVVMIPSSGGWLMRPFRYLGEISYGIYLWHMPVLLTLLEKTTWQGAQLLAATVGCTTILASLSWYGFERFWLTNGKAGPPSERIGCG
ncbi:MAG: acyltransferase family protein [Rhodoferax sp.]